MFGIPTSLGTIWAEIGLNTKKLDEGLTKAQTKLAAADKTITRFGQKLTSQSTNLMIAGGLMAGSVIAVGTASIKMAKDFDTSMRNVNSITGLTEKQLGQMSEQVIKLSTKFPQSAKTLADGLYDISSSGFQGAEALKVLEASAKAASAGMTTTEVAAKGIVSVLNAFGFEAESASKVADTMFATVDKGIITFEELSSQIGEVAGTANLAKVDFNELSGLIAYMTTKGINAAETMTALNRLMLQIIKPTDALAEVLRNAGYESGEMALKQEGLVGIMGLMEQASGGSLTKLSEMSGEMRALKASGALLGGGIEELTDFMGGFKDTTRYATKALDEQSKSLDYQLDVLRNNIKAISISLSSELIPKLSYTTSQLSEWIGKNSELATGLIKLTGGAVGGAGLLLLTASAIGKVRAAIVALNGTKLGLVGASSIGLVTTMITLLGIYATNIYNASSANEEFEKKVRETEKAENDLVIAEKSRQAILEGKNQTLRQATEEETNHLDAINLTAKDYNNYIDKQIEVKNKILESAEATKENTVQATRNIIVNTNNEAIIKNLAQAYGITEEAAKEFAKEEGLLESSIDKTTESVGKQKQSINELVESIFKLFNAHQSVTESTWNFEDAIKNYNKVMQNSASTDRDKQEALFKVQDEIEILIYKIAEEMEATKTNTQMQEALQKTYVDTGLKAVAAGAMSMGSFIETAKQFGISSGEIIMWAEETGNTLDEIAKERIIKLKLDASGFDSSLSMALNRLNQLDRRAGLFGMGGIVGSSYSMGGLVGSVPQMRASSGMVVPQTGRPIPIIAHEGEMILNTSQQNNLIEALWGVANGKSAGNQVVNNYYIEATIREEADIDKFAEKLYKMQKTNLVGGGMRGIL